AAVVGEAIESCLAQAYPNIEIIVVDDGSTDGLPSALTPYQEKINFYRKPNGGVSSARNLGLSKAGGDFVHLLDSDNLLHPDALALKVRAFGTVADADICYNMGTSYDPSAIGFGFGDLPEP